MGGTGTVGLTLPADACPTDRHDPDDLIRAAAARLGKLRAGVWHVDPHPSQRAAMAIGRVREPCVSRSIRTPRENWPAFGPYTRLTPRKKHPRGRGSELGTRIGSLKKRVWDTAVLSDLSAGPKLALQTPSRVNRALANRPHANLEDESGIRRLSARCRRGSNRDLPAALRFSR